MLGKRGVEENGMGNAIKMCINILSVSEVLFICNEFQFDIVQIVTFILDCHMKTCSASLVKSFLTLSLQFLGVWHLPVH